MTSEHDHKELYFQIRENTKAVAELRTQVALTVQSVATVAKSIESVAKSLVSHVDSHEKNTSSFKSSAINAGFQLAVLVVAVVVGAAFLQWKGN